MTPGRRPNHVLHLILTILTLGLSLIVWALLGGLMQEKRGNLHVEPNGDCDFQTI